MIKFQIGGIAVQDNTRVVRKQPLAFRLTKEQQARIKQRKLQEAARRNQAVIYDADKAKYYQNMQNFYNMDMESKLIMTLLKKRIRRKYSLILIMLKIM